MQFIEKYQKLFRKQWNKRNQVTFSYNNDEEIEEWNSIVNYLKDELPEYRNQLTFTKSGLISNYNNNIIGWSLLSSNSSQKLIYKDNTNGYINICISLPKSRSEIDDKGTMPGGKAFSIYTDKLMENGVNITDLAIPVKEGIEWKKKIPKAKIGYFMYSIKDIIYEDVHHIDFNSAYFAGISEAYPVLRPTTEEIYNSREEHPEYKEVLASCQGYFQSKCTHYQYSHLAYEGVSRTRDKVIKLAIELFKNGREPLLFNTDGIWYRGPVYHNNDEGILLGQWKHDYTHCSKFRAKSAGTYEFIHNGIYYPKQRGYTKYDSIKPRSEWQFGDIYRDDVELVRAFEIDDGIITKKYIKDEEDE